MTAPQATIFKSRVGRRVVVLFVVCALLPLWVLAQLSVSQVRELLIDQGNSRLADATRSYSRAVYERLLNTRNMTRLAVSQTAGAELPPFLAAQYLFLGRADAGGSLRAIKGDLPPEAGKLVADYRGMAAPPASLLRNLEGERLFLLFEAPGARGGETMVGELNPAYVWAEAEGFHAGTIVCVLDSTRAQYLRCPNGRELGLPQLLTNEGVTAEPSNLAWSSGGVSYRGRIQPQSLKQEFAANDWYFTISAPEAELLAAMATFRRNFMLVVALAVLLIAWVSIGQIRAMIIPLGRLTVGTRRIVENKFGTQVTVATDDEFGELGNAFNSMSARLGRQFHISKANAEIDRMIVVRDNLENIVGTTLRELQTLLPTLQAFAVLLDRVEPLLARRLSLRASALAADNFPWCSSRWDR